MNADTDREAVYRRTYDATYRALREQGYSQGDAAAIADAEAVQAAKREGEAT